MYNLKKIIKIKKIKNVLMNIDSMFEVMNMFGFKAKTEHLILNLKHLT